MVELPQMPQNAPNYQANSQLNSPDDLDKNTPDETVMAPNDQGANFQLTLPDGFDTDSSDDDSVATVSVPRRQGQGGAGG